jgi:CRP-like cAMP-binding protein
LRSDLGGLLAEMHLFAGIPEEELDEIAEVLQPVELRPGEVLFRQGAEANGLHVVATGSVGVYSRLPGGREVDLAALGIGEVIGELSLVDGGTRAATVRALERTTVFFLGRADFVALVARKGPTALTIKRRLTAIVCERLRRRYSVLCRSLAEETSPRDETPEPVGATVEELLPAAAPADRYLVRLPFFAGFAPLQLQELLDACRTLVVPSRRVLLREGVRADRAYVTLNGAVEEALERGARRIRVRLAGPGSAAGFVGLVDGRPSPVTAGTRQRALLLAVPRWTFGELFNGTTALSHAFAEAVERDLITALRQAERPQVRLAATRAQE